MQKNILLLCVCLYATVAFAQPTHTITDPHSAYKEAKDFIVKGDYAFAYTLVKEIQKKYPELKRSDYSYIYDDIHYFSILCALQLQHATAKEEARVYIASVNNNPRSQILSYHLAHAYFLENDFQKAIEYYDIAGYDNLRNDQIANAKFEKAYAYFNLKQFAKAKPLFNEIHQLPNHPYYIAANYYYGFIAYYDKEYDEALDAFQKVERNEAYSSIVPYYIAEIYYFQGKKDLVLSYGEEVLKRPGSLYYEKQLKLLMGQIHFENKNYSAALPLLEDYVNNSDKVSREVLYELSYCYYKANSYQKAIEGFKQLSNERDSMGQNSMYLLGDLYLQTNQKENARNAFQYSAFNSSNVDQQRISRFNYAKLSYELGYQNVALKEMRDYLKDYPQSEYNTEAREILVSLLTNTSNFSEALALYSEFDNPTTNMQRVYPRILYGRAIELINDQQLGTAELYLTDVLSNRYSGTLLPYAHFWKAEIAYRQFRYEEAIRHANAFVTANVAPHGEASQQTAHYNLGYSWLQKEDYAQAQVYFDRVAPRLTTQSDAMEQDAFLRAADSRFMQKNYTAASQMYSQIIQSASAQSDYAAYQKAMIAGISNSAEKIRQLNQLNRSYPNSYLVQDVNMEIALAYIAEEKFNDAIPYLKQILNAPKADGLKPSALQKLGLAYYNSGNNSEALRYYEDLISQYPRSVESDEAITIIRDIYVEEGNPDAYVSLMNKHGIIVSVSEADSLSYTAAANKYNANDCNAALQGFANYLSKYPQGSYSLDAHYYSALCHQKNKNHKAALASYDAVNARGLNKFYEPATLAAAQINYFDLKNYEEAKRYFEQLRTHAVNQDNLLEALRGLVRSHYMLKDYDHAQTASQELLAQKGLSTDDRSIGYLVLGKSEQLAKNYAAAISAFKSAAAINRSAWGAEARYELAHCQFSLDQLSEAEKSGMKVIKETGSYDIWVTKAYILLGDIFMKQKDYFNAKATFESVAKNAVIDDLKIEAQQKWEAAMAAEKEVSKIAE